MIRPLTRLPALPIAAGIAGGILLWLAGLGWWIAAGAVVAGGALAFFKHHYFAFLLYGAALGWASGCFHAPVDAPDALFDGRVRAYGAVVETISTRPGGQTMIVRIDSVGSRARLNACRPFRASIAMLPDWTAYVGQKITFNAVLEPSSERGEFPYDRSSRLTNLRHGIVAQAFVDAYRGVGTERGLRWWLYQRRMAVVKALADSDLDDDAYSLLAALTVGYGDDLDEATRQNFRAAGIAHALALSGFHVGIVMILVSVGLFPLRAFYKLRRWRMLLAMAMIWFYAAMVGMSESVVRAVVMLSVILLSKMFNQRQSSLNALCVSVAVILALSPFSLFSAGFQLSVAAVVGILALASALNPYSIQQHRAHSIAALFAVPFAAIAGTMAVTAAYFHRLPLLFCLSNFAVSILLPPLMFGGVCVLIGSALGLKAVLLCKFCNGVAWLISAIADWFGNLAFSELKDIYLSEWQIAGVVMAMAALMIVMNFRQRRVAYCAGGLLAAALVLIVFCGNRLPQSEAFVVAESGNTTVVMRHGARAVAVMSCSPRHREGARQKLERRLSDYAAASGVDTLRVTDADFVLGPYSQTDGILDIGGTSLAIIAERRSLDTIRRHIDYAIVSSRFRGDIAEVEQLVRPDTIVLGRDLSMGRSERFKAAATVPVIDLRRQRLSLD